ncbi:flavodoxin family protein [Mariniradius sediminis]|uniref:Flavodoxin family protein n=1 Tax=Mariniradius sediminis TaxID=2909237 RepID=A0ABS9BND5_9BACT|nr:flavodoxin family protein [Mariniradius sediminis]MCF1749574.1 flavodoxin family protein [Mariniradius sediminis]
MKVAIIYHSGFGHTKIVAERIAEGARKKLKDVILLDSKMAIQQPKLLLESDTLVFGSPTYFGNVSAEFKLFMESTGGAWANQLWKDKLAAGFTNSSSTNGDKLNTLTSLSIFAAQHGMLWIPLGIMPKYDSAGKQLPEPNGMASYLGLMTLSSNSHEEFFEPEDLHTAELFGQRIAELTRQLKSKSKEYTEKKNLLTTKTI